MPMPAAPYDRAAARPRPSKNPPAATTGMSTASRTVGSSSVVGTDPVWPPPSPPWMTTASAPQDATFSAWRAAPTDGMTTTSWSFSLAMSSFLGASANDATLTPCSMSRSTRCGASPASARRLTPNGWSVRPFTSVMAWSSSSYVMVALARMPSPPALAVPDTSRGPATHPMPVCTTGWRTPTSSLSGVRSSCSIISGSPRKRERSERFRGVRSLRRDLAVTQRLGVEHLADQDQLGHRRGAGLGDVAVDVDLAAAGGTDLVDRHAGVGRQQPHGVAWALEVDDREVADNTVHLVEPGGCGAGLLRARLADAGHDVDLLDEHPLAVLGHPVAGLVVDGVARRTARAEQLSLRVCEVADAGD